MKITEQRKLGSTSSARTGMLVSFDLTQKVSGDIITIFHHLLSCDCSSES